jgi:hypothetical protein
MYSLHHGDMRLAWGHTAKTEEWKHSCHENHTETQALQYNTYSTEMHSHHGDMGLAWGHAMKTEEWRHSCHKNHMETWVLQYTGTCTVQRCTVNHGDMGLAWRHAVKTEEWRHSCHENHVETWVLQYTETCRERMEIFIYHMETWDQHGDMGPAWRHGTSMETWDQHGDMGPAWRHGTSMETCSEDGGVTQHRFMLQFLLPFVTPRLPSQSYCP